VLPRRGANSNRYVPYKEKRGQGNGSLWVWHEPSRERDGARRAIDITKGSCKRSRRNRSGGNKEDLKSNRDKVNRQFRSEGQAEPTKNDDGLLREGVYKRVGRPIVQRRPKPDNREGGAVAQKQIHHRRTGTRSKAPRSRGRDGVCLLQGIITCWERDDGRLFQNTKPGKRLWKGRGKSQLPKKSHCLKLKDEESKGLAFKIKIRVFSKGGFALPSRGDSQKGRTHWHKKKGPGRWGTGRAIQHSLGIHPIRSYSSHALRPPEGIPKLKVFRKGRRLLGFWNLTHRDIWRSNSSNRGRGEDLGPESFNKKKSESHATSVESCGTIFGLEGRGKLGWKRRRWLAAYNTLLKRGRKRTFSSSARPWA